jgi:hypothetical protein
LRSVAQRMRSDFDASRQTQHRGSRGTEREEIFKKFLDLYVPRRMEVVHNSEIIAATGDASPQCDVAIIDDAAPMLQDMQSHRIVPAECVYGVIEVKSRLDGKQVVEACNNIRDIKRLARSAFANDPSHWIVIDKKCYQIAPVFGWVFAYDSIGLKNLGGKIAAWCEENPAETHPDAIWILDKGAFIWTPSDEGRPLARVVESESRTLHLLTPIVPEELLLTLLVFLSKLTANVQLPPLLLGNYMHGDQGSKIQAQWVINPSSG